MFSLSGKFSDFSVARLYPSTDFPLNPASSRSSNLGLERLSRSPRSSSFHPNLLPGSSWPGQSKTRPGMFVTPRPLRSLFLEGYLSLSATLVERLVVLFAVIEESGRLQRKQFFLP